VKQLGILFLHLGEFVFLADDDDPTERVWTDEANALADLRKEGWEITSGPGRQKAKNALERPISAIQERMRV
jgi:hypothetical protein